MLKQKPTKKKGEWRSHNPPPHPNGCFVGEAPPRKITNCELNQTDYYGWHRINNTKNKRARSIPNRMLGCHATKQAEPGQDGAGGQVERATGNNKNKSNGQSARSKGDGNGGWPKTNILCRPAAFLVTGHAIGTP